jgi:hypothetical protein
MRAHNFHTFYCNERQCAVAPTQCSSAVCGKGPADCPQCPVFPIKREFEQWVSDHDAHVEDRIWSPNVWVSRR